jgi:glycerol-3-phosphate O-acyltransferase / dihydroxyacetone phosphate acyltransferase
MLRPLHFFFNLLIRFGFWIFYEKMTWHGWAKSKFRGATIVIINHPSTMMDPLQVAGWLHRYVHFLANYSLFKNPISAFILGKLWCIPIKRREDMGEKEPLENDKSFAACDDFLRKKGCLLIAPEGTSFAERRIRPLKTGCARIAFSAEKKSNWQLGLRICPIGLTYSDPIAFRAKVFKNVGEPILVADFRAKFEENEREAVELLTDLMEKSLQDLTLSTKNEADEIYQRNLETIFLNEKKDLTETESFFQFKKIWEKCRHNPELRAKIETYLLNFKLRGIEGDPFSIVETHEIRRKKLLLSSSLMAPFAFLGYFLWLVPFGIPEFLKRKLKLYPGYNPAVWLLSGVFTVSIFWKIVYEIAQYFQLNTWQSISCVILTVPLGLLNLHFWSFKKEELNLGNFGKMVEQNHAAAALLQLERKKLVSEIFEKDGGVDF